MKHRRPCYPIVCFSSISSTEAIWKTTLLHRSGQNEMAPNLSECEGGGGDTFCLNILPWNHTCMSIDLDYPKPSPHAGIHHCLACELLQKPATAASLSTALSNCLQTAACPFLRVPFRHNPTPHCWLSHAQWRQGTFRLQNLPKEIFEARMSIKWTYLDWWLSTGKLFHHVIHI